MLSKFRSDNSYSTEAEELLQLRSMCKELRKDKDFLTESLLSEKSKNDELIQRLESTANTVLDARLREKKYIEELERELRNCSQEIGYLQEQLNLRNIESNCMGEQVHSFELKLAEVGSLHEKLRLLSEELIQSDTRQLNMMKDIKVKEEELYKNKSHIEELESAISSISLETQCEIESMRLDITTLEENCFEAERCSQEVAQEKAKVDLLLEEFEAHFQEAQEQICSLEMENKELKEKLMVNKTNARGSCTKFAEHLNDWLKHNSGTSISVPASGKHIQDFSVELRRQLSLLLKEICTCEEVLCPVVSKPAVMTAFDDNVEEMEKMANQIHELELLVTHLKEGLRREKLKAKEEAEDLTQAMAELRYQITDKLEEECKRRACIEETSLRRIQDLEEQVREEKKKSLAAMQHLQEVNNKLAEMRPMQSRHQLTAIEGLEWITDPETARVIESCSCRNCKMLEDLLRLSPEASNSSYKDDIMNQALIKWYPDNEFPSAQGL